MQKHTSNTPAFPNLRSVPCGCDPGVRRLMENALPCRCGSRNRVPVSDAAVAPVSAIACDECGEIEGDAPSLSGAVMNWNEWTKAERR